MAGSKGHWTKGRSRNLAANRVPIARNLVDALRRAIDACWRHPVHGVLTVTAVATLLKTNASTVHKWLRGLNLPPLWAVDQLRLLLRDFKP